MQILLTNDDGIYSHSLMPLKQQLSNIAQLTIIVPDRERSATGHAITLDEPLRVKEIKLPDQSKAFITNGTPADCVLLGVLDLMPQKPDVVVSGINSGPNLGHDLTYSGTVAAAMEAALFNISAFSISIASYETKEFLFAAEFAKSLAAFLAKYPLPPSTFLNVNLPALKPAQIKGIQITRQSNARCRGQPERRLDPYNRPYYWIGSTSIEEKDNNDSPFPTDLQAIHENKISITPIKLDLTNYQFLPQLKELTKLLKF